MQPVRGPGPGLGPARLVRGPRGRGQHGGEGPGTVSSWTAVVLDDAPWALSGGEER